jgi:hypothetical protein
LAAYLFCKKNTTIPGKSVTSIAHCLVVLQATPQTCQILMRATSLDRQSSFWRNPDIILCGMMEDEWRWCSVRKADQEEL